MNSTLKERGKGQHTQCIKRGREEGRDGEEKREVCIFYSYTAFLSLPHLRATLFCIPRGLRIVKE